eukprot:7391901-Prymnesium_polylepis.4
MRLDQHRRIERNVSVNEAHDPVQQETTRGRLGSNRDQRLQKRGGKLLARNAHRKFSHQSQRYARMWRGVTQSGIWPGGGDHSGSRSFFTPRSISTDPRCQRFRWARDAATATNTTACTPKYTQLIACGGTVIGHVAFREADALLGHAEVLLTQVGALPSELEGVLAGPSVLADRAILEPADRVQCAASPHSIGANEGARVEAVHRGQCGVEDVAERVRERIAALIDEVRGLEVLWRLHPPHLVHIGVVVVRRQPTLSLLRAAVHFCAGKLDLQPFRQQLATLALAGRRKAWCGGCRWRLFGLLKEERQRRDEKFWVGLHVVVEDRNISAFAIAAGLEARHVVQHVVDIAALRVVHARLCAGNVAHHGQPW